jgi:hypothetical protein
MVQELIDYRLAAYEVRRTTAAVPDNVIPLKPATSPRTELPFFPNLKIACGHFKTGSVDAEEHHGLGSSYGHLGPSRHFIARALELDQDVQIHPLPFRPDLPHHVVRPMAQVFGGAAARHLFQRLHQLEFAANVSKGEQEFDASLPEGLGSVEKFYKRPIQTLGDSLPASNKSMKRIM